MADDTTRSVTIERDSVGRYTARNARGATIPVGGDDAFTPVELLLVALGACSAIDVDTVTSRRTEPERFTVTVTGDKIQDASGGNVMANLTISFDLAFPAGGAGDAARDQVARVVKLSHDKLCTVSRTVESGGPVTVEIVDAP